MVPFGMRSMRSMRLALPVVLLIASSHIFPTASARPSVLQPSSLIGTKTKYKPKRDDAYRLLARSIQTRLNAPSNSDKSPTDYDVEAIASAFRSLSTTNAALKKIDGTAHEMYQRTHKSSTSLDDGEEDEDEGGEGGDKVAGLKVAGRMSRNAARVGCIADAFFAAELCELALLAPPVDEDGTGEGSVSEREINALYDDEEGTLAPWTGRTVVLNTTIRDGSLAMSVLVIHEPEYAGGAGNGHGGVDDLLSFAKEELEEVDEGDGDDGSNSADSKDTQAPRGRYLVVLCDQASSSQSTDLPLIISTLDSPPERLRLPPQRGDGDFASVCGPLYRFAGQLLEAIQPVLVGKQETAAKDKSDGDGSEEVDEEDDSGTAAGEDTNPQSLPAIHFVGYSLAGGTAAIAANILEGSLPPPQQRTKGKKQPRASSLSGSARGRTSAICLGPPPCISSNIQSAFVTSVIHGDDVVCRTTHGTIDHLCNRARRSLKGGLLGRGLGLMSEAVSITASGLKNSKGKEGRLAVPGKTFLVRPRRIGGGSSSIHEVGGHGREALRAAVLWQLNDVLLSKSLCAHHRLDAYIRSLDKVRLKGFVDDPSQEES